MWFGLIVLILGAVFSPSTAAASERPQFTTEDEGPAPHTQKCWVFSHMNKSGGSAIKEMMEPWVRTQTNKGVARLYDNKQWKAGVAVAEKFARYNITLIWGAYTEGLRAYGAQHDCKWFTMFRQ